MKNDPYCTIFMFINSSSGGGVGSQLLSHEVPFVIFEIQKLQFSMPISNEQPPQLVHIYFFDLLKKREKAFKLAKQITESGNLTIGIVCGGDGTIMWVVSELFNYKIDPFKIPLGVLPFGTGNDFSQYLGWGKEKSVTLDNNFKSLKKLIRRWIVARQVDFDIWDVRATIYQNGKFQKVNKNGENQVLKDTQGNLKSSIQYSFCNYFSFGIDGKIGYSFDKRRTNSRIGNLMVYGAMGVVKAATKTKTIQELVDKMEIIHEEGSEIIQKQPTIEKPRQNIKQLHFEKSKIDLKSDREVLNLENVVVFKTNTKQYQQNQHHSESFYLENDYQNLLALNINSFMGGVTDIWRKSRNSEAKGDHFSTPSSHDGKLQILCFSSSIGMALERLIGGFATKITQGGGPFHISFKRYQNQPKHRTYLQIDGEFIRFTHPKSVLISSSTLGNRGKIRVLVRNLQAQQALLI